MHSSERGNPPSPSAATPRTTLPPLPLRIDGCDRCGYSTRPAIFDFLLRRSRCTARPPPMPWPRLSTPPNAFPPSESVTMRNDEVLDGVGGFIGLLLLCRPAGLPGCSIFHRAICQAARPPPMPWPRPLYGSQCLPSLRICNDKALDGIGRFIGLLLPHHPAYLPWHHFSSHQPPSSKVASDAWATAPPRLPMPYPPPDLQQ